MTEPLVVRDPSANTRQTVDEALAAHGLTLAPPLAEVGSTSAAKATAIEEGAPVLLSAIAVNRDDEGFDVKRVRGLELGRAFVILLGLAGERVPGSPGPGRPPAPQAITSG